MDKVEILQKLDLGCSVAEYDKNLSNYFIKTSYVEEFVNDRYDIVKGVKGAGKTAMLVALCDNPNRYEVLGDVILVPAINIKGDPDFKRAFDQIENELNEQELVDAWKIYIINIIWKEIVLKAYGYEELEKYLKKNKIITTENSFFAKITYALKRASVTISNKFSPDGTTIQTVELKVANKPINDNLESNAIGFNYIFDELNEILIRNEYRLWIMMDRLDDAFPDKSQRSILALKSLLYAYKDVCIYENLKIKIFIRDDIFNNITIKGFTSLTHIATKTMAPIKWDKNKIEQLLLERLLFNDSFIKNILAQNINIENINVEIRKKIIGFLLRKQVDIGKKNPDSIGWIINHIKDGTNIFTPRDFIGLIDKARQYQLQKYKNGKSDKDEEYLIGAYAIRKAYQDISQEKLESQLYAEYPEMRTWIEKFKDNKAEHNEVTLKKLLGKQWKSRVRKLVDIGFIEEKKSSWKIPFLYTKGLNIKGGKAF